MSKSDREPTALTKTGGAGLPAKLEPLMLAHLVLSGDRAQQEQWRSKLESIRQADAVSAATDPETKAILANKDAWRQMKVTGRLGASFGLGLTSFWMAWLLPTYAIGHGFGWLAAATFMIPVPFAYRFGRRLWEQAALAGMRDLGSRPSFRRRVKVGLRSIFRSFIAGFGLGFSVVFLQALITYFMTPAPTLLLELLYDAYDGVQAGLLTGVMGMMLAPLVGRGLPDGSNHTLGTGASLARLEED